MNDSTDFMPVTEMSTEAFTTDYSYYDLSASDFPKIDRLLRSQNDVNFTEYTLAIFYVLMFVFSLCTNALVLVVIYRFEKLTTVTNLLLLNLVLSSLLFIISLPFVAVYTLISHWPFGGVMCKLVGSLYYLGFYSSVLFLAVLTFDRHLAVVYSLSAHRLRSRAYALSSCAVVWLLSALACIKPMIVQKSFTNQINNKTFCQEDPDSIDPRLWNLGFYTQLLLFFLFPLLIVIYCYSRIICTVLSSQFKTSFRTVRLIFVIVLLFFLCWTPFNIALLMFESASTREERNRWRNVLKVTQKFAHLYFCVCPIFYTFVGKKFQNYFRMLLVRRFPRLKKHLEERQTNRTTTMSPVI